MKKIFGTLIGLSLPLVALAQSTPVTDINSLSARLIGISDIITYLLITLAVLFIIWNIVMYLIKGNDQEGRKKAAASIGWGILGLFIIFSIWGIVNILAGTFKTVQPNIRPGPNPVGGLPVIN